MPKKITIIQGHPDPANNRFCHALEMAYIEGAKNGGHAVKRIDVANLDFPLLRTREEFEHGDPPPGIVDSQEAIAWADHIVVIYPLWLGTMPALMKGFLEQTFRYGFAIGTIEEKRMPRGLLTGKTARVVITMGMPAFIYRWFFGAHSLKSLERNILKMSGIKPVYESLIGNIDAPSDKKRMKWLKEMATLGKRGV